MRLHRCSLYVHGRGNGVFCRFLTYIVLCKNVWFRVLYYHKSAVFALNLKHYHFQIVLHLTSNLISIVFSQKRPRCSLISIAIKHNFCIRCSKHLKFRENIHLKSINSIFLLIQTHLVIGYLHEQLQWNEVHGIKFNTHIFARLAACSSTVPVH